MILKEIADRMHHAKISREQALRRNRAGMLALGVTLGGTVGALAGVLFAPKTGKETREELSRRGSEVWEKVKENASTAGNRLVSAVEEKSSRVCTAADKAVDAARESLREPSRENEEGN